MIVIGRQSPSELGDPLQSVQTLDVATTKEFLKSLLRFAERPQPAT
jgi:hypothetical protein